MSIVVTKCSEEVVGPSEHGMPTNNIHLSSFDMSLGSMPVSLLLVFDKPIPNPVDTIRTALSRALVHYYPISGRLEAGADGGEVITFTGEGQGVLFVGASASGALDDVLSLPAKLDDLFLRYHGGLCRHADALLQMQVTEFSCGGFVVGVTWNHVLADGEGMGQFLQAIGELARGMSLPSIVPVRSDVSVLAARAQGGAAETDFSCAQLTQGMAYLDFTIPSSFISHVKYLCTCTLFEAVVSILWQCRARAVMSDYPADCPSSLVFGYNMRGLIGAARGYYGNCLVRVSVVASTTEVANGDMKDVVKLIQIAKKKIQDKMKNGDVVDPVRLEIGYNSVVLASWRNLGLEVPDFGGGRPARVIWYMPQSYSPFFVLCPPCKGNDGVNVLGYIVKKEHANAFMREIAACGGHDE